MCGIIGVYARDGSPVDETLVQRMRDTMVHRGPDDFGLWTSPRRDAVLAHRRLAIVDLSPAGRAPMSNEDGSVQVTFNGEIYNHAQLRTELENGAHHFRSNCDTEVLVHLWEDSGPEMVQRLVGMFAFAVWDTRRKMMFIARDRLGIKPLYWFDDGRRFACASEIKALLPLLTHTEIDETALVHYLSFVAVPPPRTLIAGIQKLPPASTMLVGQTGPQQVQRYWDPIANRCTFGGASSEWEAELLRRLRTSIERRMMSDVPVGVFLSGGVDSSTNVALMTSLVDHPINTFSIGFHGSERYNEFAWARRIATQYGTNHSEVKIDEGDLWRFLPSLVHHQDEPIADPVCVPVYFVAKLAKEHGVTVVHVGEGADELFAGYDNYIQAQRISQRYWQPFRRMPDNVRSLFASLGQRVLASNPNREIHREALRRVRSRMGTSGGAERSPSTSRRFGGSPHPSCGREWRASGLET